jgi:hypothetical protein
MALRGSGSQGDFLGEISTPSSEKNTLGPLERLPKLGQTARAKRPGFLEQTKLDTCTLPGSPKQVNPSIP